MCGLLCIVAKGRFVAERQVISSTMFTISIDSITLLSDYVIVSFQRKRLPLENFDNIQLLVEKFMIHTLNASP